MRKTIIVVGLLSLLTACGNFAQVKVEVVSERTALENQVLGTYNAIDREMLLTASVNLRLSPDFKVFPCRSMGCTALSLLIASVASGTVAVRARPWERVFAHGNADVENVIGGSGSSLSGDVK